MVTGLAIGGPLFVLFLLGRGMDRQGLRASMAFFFTVMYSTALAGYAVQGLMTSERMLLGRRNGPRGGPRLLALGASHGADEREGLSPGGRRRNSGDEHAGAGAGAHFAVAGACPCPVLDCHFA